MLAISDDRPVSYSDEDGILRYVSPRSIERIPGGVRIILSDGSLINVQIIRKSASSTNAETANDVARAEGFSLTIKPSVGNNIVFSFAYELSSRSSLVFKNNVLLLEASGGPFSLNLPAKAVDEKSGRFLVSAGSARGLSVFKAAKTESSPAKPEQFIAQAPKDPAEFKVITDAWVTKVWAGLSTSRWDSERLGWRDSAGEPRFSERALAAYLAESLARNSYPEALQRSKPLKTRYSASLSHVTVPFFGDTIARMQALEASDLIEVRRLQSLVQAKDPSLFEKENLVHFLMDRAPYTLAQDALRFASELELAKLNLRQSIGVLACAAESRSYLKNDENPFSAHGAVADRLVGYVKKTDAGHFLQTEEDGSTDLRLSLLAGVRFMDFGKAEGREIFIGIGQSLVEGVLGLSDANGFVPSRAITKSGLLDQRTGSIAPEDLYPLVATNPYYPREVSFYRDVSPGVWAWTCAPSLTVQASPAKYSFTSTFPVGLAHYMAFYGVKPFSNIKLYGIDYSPDAEFEMYNVSGYLYRKASSALYLKLKHKANSELMELFF